MTSEIELTAETREQLTKVRTSLVSLHKTLLDFERAQYERRTRRDRQQLPVFAVGDERSVVCVAAAAFGTYRGDG